MDGSYIDRARRRPDHGTVYGVTTNDLLSRKTPWSNKMYRYAIAVIFAFDVWYLAATQNDCRPKDCYDLKCYRVSKAKDGPHIIYPDTPTLINLQVSCDQETDGGGWIIYMRRLDGTVDFTRNWAAYKYGFGKNGDNMTELWLGNENIYQVLQTYGTTECELRMEVDAFDETNRWLVAINFRMNNESDQYTLNWDNVTGPYPELYANWNYHKFLEFRTIDSENQQCVGKVGALHDMNGGWWYGSCAKIFLTGEYVDEEVETYKSIMVWDFKWKYSLKRARMMVRPTNDTRPCNNPCKNGGTCVHLTGLIGHRCTCKSEWCGTTCEVKNPCQNGAICEAVEYPPGHHCACSSGWCGVTCEVVNMCQNDAICVAVEDPLGHHCACSSEWCGVTCEVNNQCMNGGTCEVDAMTNTTTCKCDAEFTGLTCEDRTGEVTTSKDTTGEVTTSVVTTSEDATGEDTARADTNGDETTVADTNSDETTVADTNGEETTVADTNGDETTAADTNGDETTVADTNGDETTVADTNGDETTGADTNGDETTVADTNGDETTVADTNGDETTGADTTSDATTVGEKVISEMAAFRYSSAACPTNNCGVIAALLILRRRLFGFFGF